MFDPILHASALLFYAAVGLAVALWRLVKVGVMAVAGGVVAWLYERELDRAGLYQPEEESDGTPIEHASSGQRTTTPEQRQHERTAAEGH